MQRTLQLILSGILFYILFSGCQKEVIDASYFPGPDTTTHYIVDDATQVTASVSGVVLDENGQPFAGATVSCGR